LVDVKLAIAADYYRGAIPTFFTKMHSACRYSRGSKKRGRLLNTELFARRLQFESRALIVCARQNNRSAQRTQWQRYRRQTDGHTEKNH